MEVDLSDFRDGMVTAVLEMRRAKEKSTKKRIKTFRKLVDYLKAMMDDKENSNTIEHLVNSFDEFPSLIGTAVELYMQGNDAPGGSKTMLDMGAKFSDALEAILVYLRYWCNDDPTRPLMTSVTMPLLNEMLRVWSESSGDWKLTILVGTPLFYLLLDLDKYNITMVKEWSKEVRPYIYKLAQGVSVVGDFTSQYKIINILLQWLRWIDRDVGEKLMDKCFHMLESSERDILLGSVNTEVESDVARDFLTCLNSNPIILKRSVITSIASKFFLAGEEILTPPLNREEFWMDFSMKSRRIHTVISLSSIDWVDVDIPFDSIESVCLTWVKKKDGTDFKISDFGTQLSSRNSSEPGNTSTYVCFLHLLLKEAFSDLTIELQRVCEVESRSLFLVFSNGSLLEDTLDAMKVIAHTQDSHSCAIPQTLLELVKREEYQRQSIASCVKEEICSPSSISDTGSFISATLPIQEEPRDSLQESQIFSPIGRVLTAENVSTPLSNIVKLEDSMKENNAPLVDEDPFSILHTGSSRQEDPDSPPESQIFNPIRQGLTAGNVPTPLNNIVKLEDSMKENVAPSVDEDPSSILHTSLSHQEDPQSPLESQIFSPIGQVLTTGNISTPLTPLRSIVKLEDSMKENDAPSEEEDPFSILHTGSSHQEDPQSPLESQIFSPLGQGLTAENVPTPLSNIVKLKDTIKENVAPSENKDPSAILHISSSHEENPNSLQESQIFSPIGRLITAENVPTPLNNIVKQVDSTKENVAPKEDEDPSWILHIDSSHQEDPDWPDSSQESQIFSPIRRVLTAENLPTPLSNMVNQVESTKENVAPSKDEEEPSAILHTDSSHQENPDSPLESQMFSPLGQVLTDKNLSTHLSNVKVVNPMKIPMRPRKPCPKVHGKRPCYASENLIRLEKERSQLVQENLGITLSQIQISDPYEFSKSWDFFIGIKLRTYGRKKKRPLIQTRRSSSSKRRKITGNCEVEDDLDQLLAKLPARDKTLSKRKNK